ncbi:MAG TPA: hypothetical protein VF796_06050 [Humisphaera sp.]
MPTPASRGYAPFDLSPGEVVFGLFAGAVAVGSVVGFFGVVRRFRGVVWLRPGGRRARDGAIARRLVVGGITAGLLATLGVLLGWSDPVHVRGHLDYTLLFLVAAAAWQGLVAATVPWVGGFSLRDDVGERANVAAAWPAAAALAGAGVLFGLANAGAGDTIWTTVVPVAMATVAWLVLWLTLSLATGLPGRIAIGRDVAAGVRLAAYLMASAVVLGAATMGDFVSYGAAAADLVRLGWPVRIVWAIAAAAERVHRPTPARPVGAVGRDAGWVVVKHTVVAAIAVARAAGRWP